MSGFDRNSDSAENKVMEESTNSFFLSLLDQIRKMNLDFLSIQAFKIRVLVNWVLPLLNMKLEDVYALKDKFYIHPQCSLAINKLLSSLKLSPLDKILVQSLMSQDFHDVKILVEFGKMLTRLLAGEDCPELKKNKNELDKIFAIDGTEGDFTKYEKYIYNLRYPLKVDKEDKDFVMTHFHAVRQLYDEFDKTVTSGHVNHALEIVFGKNNDDIFGKNNEKVFGKNNEDIFGKNNEDDRDYYNQLAELYESYFQHKKN